jgi:uncharacterized protein YndB with AHSA1/START domain
MADIHVVTDETTLTLTASFAAPPERLWQVWADPRQLERWWGPPGYPATVVEHELTPGGVVTYFMTGPDGERHRGWWRVTEVDQPRLLRLVDGFGEGPDDDDAGLPTSSTTVTLEATDGGTRMTLVGAYDSPEEFAKVMSMGMEEGITLAVGQIDTLLAE